ncbi:MAG: diaminopimelate epimerase [Lachnospiraceae bacterium]|nr:diaminopimelate epimerase [Lachnospiraceae bacterium]
MKFTKMHGCGNDYIYVNGFEEQIDNPNETAEKVSNVRFGIGSDGMVIIHPSKIADFRMAMYNADGSEGAMCGNAIRCIGKYVYDNGMTDKTVVTVETKAGIKTLNLNVEDGKVSTVRVDMGAPILKPELIPVKYDGETMIDKPLTVDGKEYQVTCISMGNPHCVTFVEDTKSLNLEQIGPSFEKHQVFPDRVNTEFVQIIDRNTVNMRVWERGSGETWACGTGACACVMACILNGHTEDKVLVHLVGGDLLIEYDRENNTIFMTGPAVTVCYGELL